VGKDQPRRWFQTVAIPPFTNNGHKWREERVQRLNLTARENPEERESLDGDHIELGVCVDQERCCRFYPTRERRGVDGNMER